MRGWWETSANGEVGRLEGSRERHEMYWFGRRSFESFRAPQLNFKRCLCNRPILSHAISLWATRAKGRIDSHHGLSKILLSKSCTIMQSGLRLRAVRARSTKIFPG